MLLKQADSTQSCDQIVAVLPKDWCTRHSTTHTLSHRDSLISVGTDSSIFIVQCAVDVGTVVEGPVSPFDWSSSSLVHEVPVEAGERSVLVALVLQECLTLLHSELFQVSGGGGERGEDRGGEGGLSRSLPERLAM